MKKIAIIVLIIIFPLSFVDLGGFTKIFHFVLLLSGFLSCSILFGGERVIKRED